MTAHDGNRWQWRDWTVLVRRARDDEPVARVAVGTAQSARQCVPTAQYAIRLVEGADQEPVYAEIRPADRPHSEPLRVER